MDECDGVECAVLLPYSGLDEHTAAFLPRAVVAVVHSNVSTNHFPACDLGAESVGLMVATVGPTRGTLLELHRFANAPARRRDSLRWDIGRLWAELRNGLKKAGESTLSFTAISTDSWGVDYVLLGS